MSISNPPKAKSLRSNIPPNNISINIESLFTPEPQEKRISKPSLKMCEICDGKAIGAIPFWLCGPKLPKISDIDDKGEETKDQVDDEEKEVYIVGIDCKGTL